MHIPLIAELELQITVSYIDYSSEHWGTGIFKKIYFILFFWYSKAAGSSVLNYGVAYGTP